MAKKKTTSRTNEPYFELMVHEGLSMWRLWSGNGRPLADSPEGYPSPKHAIQAIRTLAGVVANAKVIVRGGGDEEAEEGVDVAGAIV